MVTKEANKHLQRECRYGTKTWHAIWRPWLGLLSFQIARFMGPTWGPPGSCRPQMGPMLAPWTLLSGLVHYHPSRVLNIVCRSGNGSSNEPQRLDGMTGYPYISPCRHTNTSTECQWGALYTCIYPDSKVYGTYMRPTWDRQDPGGPMLAAWTLLSGYIFRCTYNCIIQVLQWLIWQIYNGIMRKSQPIICKMK